MSPRKAVLAALGIAALVSAGIAYSSSGERSKAMLPIPGAHVYGGGQFGPGTFPNGLTFYRPRDFSVDAHKVGSAVSGHVYYGINGAGTLILGGDVTCLSVAGDTAAVGGIIRGSSDPASVGYGFVIFFTDNGSPVSETRDESSPAFIDPLSGSAWPAGFPNVCPAPDGPFNAVGTVDVHSGDVVVQGG